MYYMKCSNVGFISSYTLNSQLLTIPLVPLYKKVSNKPVTNKPVTNKTVTNKTLSKTYLNYLKGISFSKSNF